MLPGNLVNKNAKLRTTVEPQKSFIFDELNYEQLDDFVHEASVYNRHAFGLSVKNFEKESIINKRYQIVATFNEAPQLDPSSTMRLEPSNQNEYVAIMESLDIPLYLISYDLSYT